MSNGRRLRRSIKGVKGKHARHDPKRNRGFCGRRDDVAIAVCRGICGRYTTVWLPAKVCERCLLKIAFSKGLLDDAFGLPPRDDREPQPSDGPDYHEEHAAWERRQEVVA